MKCGGCVGHVKKILEEQEGVTGASVNLATETALVRVHLAAGADAQQVAEQLAQVRGGGAAPLTRPLPCSFQHCGWRMHLVINAMHWHILSPTPCCPCTPLLPPGAHTGWFQVSPASQGCPRLGHHQHGHQKGAEDGAPAPGTHGAGALSILVPSKPPRLSPASCGPGGAGGVPAEQPP